MLRMMREKGLENKIRVVEMNPPDMASALAVGLLDAYFVGEPFAAQTLKAGAAELLFHVEDIWPGFICNLVLVKEDFIRKQTDVVQSLVEGAARSGAWAQKHCDEAAKIASSYWGQPVPLVQYALNTPAGRIVFDRFVPVEAELQQMAELMVQFGLLKDAYIDGLVDDRFARQADLTGISDVNSILKAPASVSSP